MTRKQIIEEAIQKAIDGGWMDGIDSYSFVGNRVSLSLSEITTLELTYPELIFNHEFCKALWGEKEVGYYDVVDLDNGGKTEIVTMPIWHYRLKQMVIAEDPIKYLGEHL